MPDHDIWTVKATPEAPALARQRVREVAVRHGAEEALQRDIALCVSEAVTNAILHAYRDAPEAGPIEIETVRNQDSLCIYIRDSGSGVETNPASPGLGLGVPFMTQLADQFELRAATSGGTEVVMHFPLR